jgi:hypothetical protein
MNTLIKLIVILVLWQTGLLSDLLIIAGGLLMWAGAVLQPHYLLFGMI